MISELKQKKKKNVCFEIYYFFGHLEAAEVNLLWLYNSRFNKHKMKNN